MSSSVNTNTIQTLEYLITEQMLDVMENGEIKVSNDGAVVTDQDGEPLRVPPSAAMIGQAIKWFDKLNMKTPSGVDVSVERAMDMMRTSRNKGGPIPIINVEDDDDATNPHREE